MDNLIGDQIWAILDPTTKKRIPCILLSIEKTEGGEVFWVREVNATDGRRVSFGVEEIYIDECGQDDHELSNDNFDRTLIFQKASEKIILNHQNSLPILVGTFEAMEIIRESLESQYINTDIESDFIDYLEKNNILKII